MASPNPRKRGAPALPVGSGNARKRAKLQVARSIAIRCSTPRLREGNINVPSFIDERQFEIKSLETSMASSRRANNKRAFQLIPHSMRRRTASHNVKRVPKRLRRRAAHEMKEDNTPTVTSRTRKKTGHMRLRIETARKLRDMAKKGGLTAELLSRTPASRAVEDRVRNPPRASTKFRRRQREKTWLPTHIWHAKRARMVTRWRYAVAETPMDKCYRPTHRASQMRGAVAWDESYFSTVQLKGRVENIKAVLKTITGKGTDALSTLVMAGKRSCETWLYHPNSFPTQPIAPATLIWCAPDPDPSSPRYLFFRLHPAAFLEFWTALVPIAKQHSLTLEDLRFEIGSIELTGPDATDTLLSVLRPISPSSPSAALWLQLRSLTNPSALPPGALLNFTISDPRLRFPPRLPESTLTPSELSASIFNTCSTWPLDQTPPSPAALFSRTARTIAVKSQSSQKNINNRKGAAAPGTYPPHLASDPVVPILLFAARRASPAKGVSGAIGSWVLMLPWKWVLPVWYSLMHAGPTVRFGGVEQRRQVAFESGVGCFPDDFPGTRAGVAEEERKGGDRRELWGRKPKGKKVEWGSVPVGEGRGEVGDGFVCDWEWLVGGKAAAESVAAGAETTVADGPAVESVAADGPVAESAAADETMDVDAPAPSTSTPSTTPLPPPPVPIWNIPAPLITLLLTKPHKPLPPSLLSLPATTLSRAVFTVKLTYLQRGTPASRARIYRLPVTNPTLRAKWLALVAKRQKAGTEEYPPVPGAEDCIGFVTTGNFNLKEGLGVGLGALAFEKVFGRGGTPVGKMCIVRDVGTGIGRLVRWEVV